MMLMRPSGFFCYILCLLLESYMSLCVIAFMNESYESCLRVCVSCMRGPCTRARSHVREHVLTYESKISLYDDAAISQLHMLRPRYATHRLMYENVYLFLSFIPPPVYRLGRQGNAAVPADAPPLHPCSARLPELLELSVCLLNDRGKCDRLPGVCLMLRLERLWRGSIDGRARKEALARSGRFPLKDERGKE